MMQERIIAKPDEMKWVTIPAGEFIMGVGGIAEPPHQGA